MRKFLLLLALTCSGGLVAAPHQVGKFGTGLLKEKKATKKYGLTTVTLDDCGDLPADFDLRDLKVVPPTRNQGSCGSCWSFAKTGSLESFLLGQGINVNLSEQELVSCDKRNYGCNGGLLNSTEYQISKGQGLEADFPYTSGSTGKTGSCKQIATAHKAVSMVYVGGSSTPSQRQVQCALYKSRTIPWTTVRAYSGDWNNPPKTDNGVFSKCAEGGTNHAVGIVGWRTISGKFFWVMRNSWGTGWGSTGGRPGAEKGFALMPNKCNSLNDEVAYLIGKTSLPCKPPLPKLPVRVEARTGDEIVLAVKAETNVEYEWYKGATKIGTGTSAPVIVSEDGDYKVVGKNSCGTGESVVSVHALKAAELIETPQ